MVLPGFVALGGETLGLDGRAEHLKWLQDKPDHITIGPATAMTLDAFRQALAATQASWVNVEPCD